uniref:CENP-V/GFA domain-containing protein n=1 Tax=Prasinoderma coloniale TaxID=156133 RepID=A0A7R9TFM6_9VIRI|eukprot:PRCOL_00006023-RA
MAPAGACPGGPVVHRGGCHCGAVRFEFEGGPRLKAWRCNCSICAMKRNDHTMVPAARFRLLAPAALDATAPRAGGDGSAHRVISEYRFGTHTARHLFCSTCGICPFYVPRSNPDGFGVNVHCIDEGTADVVTFADFDGRDWEGSFAATGIAAETDVGDG